MPRRWTPDDFWARVEKGSGCWLWRGATTSNGMAYGNLNGERIPARRIAYHLATGWVMDDERRLLSSCRNPLCVNPAHAELKLGDAQRGEIAAAIERGETHQAIADRYGVRRETVSRLNGWARKEVS